MLTTFGQHLRPFDPFGVLEQPQRFGFSEVIEREDAPANWVAVAPVVAVIHRHNVARRWSLREPSLNVTNSLHCVTAANTAAL